MIYLKTNAYLTILYLLLFVPFSANSQDTTEKSLAEAIQLFDVGNYSEAAPLFNSVLKKQPDNFMVNYYYGACRTEENHFTNSDLELLIKASQEVNPVQINYYFGVQYHARSNWERALKFYNIYNTTATPEEKKEKGILEKIQQCYDKVNPFEKFIVEENADNGESHAPVEATSTRVKRRKGNSKRNSVNQSGTGKKTAVQNNDYIEFPVNLEITYVLLSHFKTEEGKSKYKEGTLKKKELEDAILKAKDLRVKYNNTKTASEKKVLGRLILNLESESYALKKESTELLMAAKDLEYEYWENANPGERARFIKELKQIDQKRKQVADLTIQRSMDTSKMIDPVILIEQGDMVIQEETETEPDLIYKIQIGAYSRGLPPYIKRLYKKLSLIRKIENYTDEKGIVVYTTGNLSNLQDAIIMQNQVRQEGVEDAYVVPYFKGKRITLREAKELEEKK